MERRAENGSYPEPTRDRGYIVEWFSESLFPASLTSGDWDHIFTYEIYIDLHDNCHTLAELEYCEGIADAFKLYCLEYQIAFCTSYDIRPLEEFSRLALDEAGDEDTVASVMGIPQVYLEYLYRRKFLTAFGNMVPPARLAPPVELYSVGSVTSTIDPHDWMEMELARREVFSCLPPTHVSAGSGERGSSEVEPAREGDAGFFERQAAANTSFPFPGEFMADTIFSMQNLEALRRQPVQSLDDAPYELAWAFKYYCQLYLNMTIEGVMRLSGAESLSNSEITSFPVIGEYSVQSVLGATDADLCQVYDRFCEGFRKTVEQRIADAEISLEIQCLKELAMPPSEHAFVERGDAAPAARDPLKRVVPTSEEQVVMFCRKLVTDEVQMAALTACLGTSRVFRAARMALNRRVPLEWIQAPGTNNGWDAACRKVGVETPQLRMMLINAMNHVPVRSVLTKLVELEYKEAQRKKLAAVLGAPGVPRRK
ncbi:hypothetical protein [Streptomyces sp. NPDC057910]|uniref:hypothetical protein n=1 Tax=Streptomyces sp. NPDC057910 TaxID=3346278 RepID=UPI0036F068CE